jgi:hypothetical protein
MPLDSNSRTLALAAAHREATRLSQQADDDTGWPASVTTVTAQVHPGSVPDQNTGQKCDSGTIIEIELLGTFDKVVISGAGSNGQTRSVDVENLTVHAISASADAISGLVCSVSVRTGAVSLDPETTVLFAR